MSVKKDSEEHKEMKMVRIPYPAVEVSLHEINQSLIILTAQLEALIKEKKQ